MISYLVTVVILVAIASLVGLALNLQWGLAGLVNFGVAGFVALGAYTLAISAPYVGWLAGLALAAAVCAGLSMLLSLLTIRLEENYLAIVTIGFAEIVRILLLNLGGLTGGALGIADIPRPFASITPAGWGDAVILAFAVGLVAIVFVFSEALVRSPFGRALRAVRDDATAAAALGKPVLALRVRAFAIGGAIMGVAGALHRQASICWRWTSMASLMSSNTISRPFCSTIPAEQYSLMVPVEWEAMMRPARARRSAKARAHFS